ncbi:hypothetical protein J2X68_008056 [Streptomyces sp. 3330]|uniref:hypothetical protein n=1 Tax=Streptomyces sp. 3330 TaxID=2817755 RepID=UPI00285985E6|nr:hypothetical protein [Streptomyces sp. 3330]MDR6981313.1 hypothetical protein [Streptomyces sp. 3330]
MTILTDAGYRGLPALSGGRVMTPAHREFKKNALTWYGEWHELQRTARSSRLIHVQRGITHLEN